MLTATLVVAMPGCTSPGAQANDTNPEPPDAGGAPTASEWSIRLRNCSGLEAVFEGHTESFPFDPPMEWPNERPLPLAGYFVHVFRCAEILGGDEIVAKDAGIAVELHTNVSWPDHFNVNSDGLSAPLAWYADNSTLVEYMQDLGAPVRLASISLEAHGANPHAEVRSGDSTIELDITRLRDARSTRVPTIEHLAMPGVHHRLLTIETQADTFGTYVVSEARFTGNAPGARIFTEEAAGSFTRGFITELTATMEWFG